MYSEVIISSEQIEKLEGLITMDAGALVIIDLLWSDPQRMITWKAWDTTPEGLAMSLLGIMSSATILNDCERGNCVQQTSTETTGRPRGTQRQPRIKISSPTSHVDTGAGDNRPTKQRRTVPAAVVEQNTTEGNARGRKQLTLPTVQPDTRRGNTRRGNRRRLATADGEHGTAAENAMPKGQRRKKVFELDLTPAERAIPDTPLLSDLGYHLSAYARVGRGPPTQNLYCRGAWCNAVKLYRKANDQYKELFITAGFGDFLQIEPVEVPVAYSLALLERWFGKTNTLHLSSCEIGPTPVDWTMVTGVPFGGRSIGVKPISMDRALELLGFGKEAIVDNKIGLSKIIPSEKELEDEPATGEVKEKVFRRLFLYVIGSCFFNNNRSVISHKLVECLERIDKVRNYDWGAMTFAAFLAGMRRKVTAEIGALTAFWQFLPFWAFEYLDINRPKDPANNVFPRANRWICLKRPSDNDSSQLFSPNFIASRCQLACVEESQVGDHLVFHLYFQFCFSIFTFYFQVTWQPYLASAEYSSRSMKSTINLAKKRIAFQSIDTWEYYLGERCLRQLGFPCRVPLDPPQMMYGTWEDRVKNKYVWNGTSAENLVNERMEYASWFTTASVGRILNVNPYLGGLDTARKAKHRPDLILINQSEYKKLKEDRDAAEEKLAKLRHELVRFQSFFAFTFLFCDNYFS
ncbi:uncharacterized protein LOC141711923 isoform X3 [Apium graveolens]|uniref:uncharacterized protein LOC141711923 isoform X3 n=1 Tax=Apium graveolens TaxID=4045 RepID=UPI003D79797B